MMCTRLQVVEALFKACEDSKWIGDVCRAIGGQSVALDFGQQQMVSVIREILTNGGER